MTAQRAHYSDLESMTSFAFQGRNIAAADVISLGRFGANQAAALMGDRWYLIPGTNRTNAKFPVITFRNLQGADNTDFHTLSDFTPANGRKRTVVTATRLDGRIEEVNILFSPDAERLLVLMPNEGVLTLRIARPREPLTPGQTDLNGVYTDSIASLKSSGDANYTDANGYVFTLNPLQVRALMELNNAGEFVRMNLFFIPDNSETEGVFQQRVTLYKAKANYSEVLTGFNNFKSPFQTVVDRVLGLITAAIEPLKEQIARLVSGESIAFAMSIQGIPDRSIRNTSDLPQAGVSFTIVLNVRGAVNKSTHDLRITANALPITVVNPGQVLVDGDNDIEVQITDAPNRVAIEAAAGNRHALILQALKGGAVSDPFSIFLYPILPDIPRELEGKSFIASGRLNGRGESAYFDIDPTNTNVGRLQSRPDAHFIAYTSDGRRIDRSFVPPAVFPAFNTHNYLNALLAAQRIATRVDTHYSLEFTGANAPPADTTFLSEWQARVGEYDYYRDTLTLTYEAVGPVTNAINTLGGPAVGRTLPLEIWGRRGTEQECAEATILSIDEVNRKIVCQVKRNAYRASSDGTFPFHSDVFNGSSARFLIAGRAYMTPTTLVYRYNEEAAPVDGVHVADLAFAPNITPNPLSRANAPWFRVVEPHHFNYRNENLSPWEYVNDKMYRSTAPSNVNVFGETVHVPAGTIIDITQSLILQNNPLEIALEAEIDEYIRLKRNPTTFWVHWILQRDGTITFDLRFPNRDLNGTSVDPGRRGRVLFRTRVTRTVQGRAAVFTFTQDYNWFTYEKYHLHKKVPTEDTIRLAVPVVGGTRYPTLVGEPSFSGGRTRIPFKKGLFTISDFKPLSGNRSWAMDHNFDVLFEFFNAFNSRNLSIITQPSKVSNEYAELSTTVNGSASSSGAYGKIKLIGDRKKQADLDNEFPG